MVPLVKKNAMSAIEKLRLRQFWYHKNIRWMTLAVTCTAVGVIAGWWLHKTVRMNVSSREADAPLRMNGYTFIKPLLLCDSKYEKDSESVKQIREKVEQYIDQNIQSGSIKTASVFFRYLNSGEEFNINPNEQYYPASLQKLPLMMQYFKEAESNPELLTAKKPYVMKVDKNFGTTIPPVNSPTLGHEYSAEDLIGYMIKYSDNNSFDVLFGGLGSQKYEEIYKIMQLQYPHSYASDKDFITPYQLSLFFRTLYNATYLDADYSEKALALLTQTDYRRALVRDLPQTVKVAHKFGIYSVKEPGGNAYGELHDCGIVYKGENPYLLCIMTKSKSNEVATVENVIATISQLVYHTAD